MKVTNAGPSAATGVVATIPLPAGVQFVSASASQGVAPAPQGGVLTADVGNIASGGSATITIVIDPTPADSGGSIPLAAQVAGQQFDPDASNNQASLNLSIAPSVNVTLNLASTPQVVMSGQMVTFTATVANLGASTATDVVVSFPTASGLASLSSTPSQGAMAEVSGQLFAHLGDLAPGATATVTMQTMAISPGTLTETASVSQDQYNLDQWAASASTSRRSWNPRARSSSARGATS